MLTCNPNWPCARKQSGVGLIEMMVSMVISMILLIAVVSAVITGSRNNYEVSLQSRLTENGRYALNLLQDEIQHAGFYGHHYLLGLAPPVLPDVCNTSLVSVLGSIMVPIYGFDSPSGTPPVSCLQDANHVDGTDILVIRRVSTSVTSSGNLQDGEFYLQANRTQFALNLGENSGNFNLLKLDGLSVEDIRKFRVDIYFISPCHRPSGSVCDANADNGDPIPTLKRLELTTDGTNPTFTMVPLVENVEDMQFDFGLDKNLDGATDLPYVKSPGTPSDWANTVNIIVHLLIRSPEPSSGYDNQKIYSMGLEGNVGPFGDTYKRRIFTASVRAINVSARREQP